MDSLQKNETTTMKLSAILILPMALLWLPTAESFTTPSKLTRMPAVAHPMTRLEMAADPEAKKETTWDRITGPKLFKTVTNWSGIHSVPLVPLRILTGMLMIHHGSEGKSPIEVPCLQYLQIF